ncbi:phage shock protein PspA [Wenzhouxiangella sp. XN24]|uniref:phage shock protein PspA n=1 Tax=Wenzhouxiangella sp. XN24 TaxID=2713569 RepID=UPI0013EB4E7C|nr:phage shock protein PspA [Wenzhouxiangella sp. XN24]NGX17276.1 phage shock protein PspA [Wenzhouxiangella sp. XN24]
MGIFSRFSDIVNSNINALLEKAEDPEKMVRLIIQEMEDTLVEVRSAAARAIADRKQLDRRLGDARREGDDWARKAELAVRKGRDDLARAALAEKAHAEERITGLEAQGQQVETVLAQLNEDMARLQEKLADAKTRQKAMILRHRTAGHRLEMRRQIHETKIDDALVRFEQFERKLEDAEGRVEAYDLGQRKDLGREFASLESAESVEAELAALKRRVGEDSRGEA